ncbi:hypothetical protein KGN15_003870 [Lactococcus lactis]|nr:hypothetical protein [Lactococcus lactis]MBU7533465.1 hypothetical protein [Lactococcus lactis]
MTIVTRNSLTLSNVNDGTITHTAYAYSADGKDRFTNVYPNLNLLTGTKNFSNIHLNQDIGFSLNEMLSDPVTQNNVLHVKTTGYINSGAYLSLSNHNITSNTINIGTTITVSMKAKGTGNFNWGLETSNEQNITLTGDYVTYSFTTTLKSYNGAFVFYSANTVGGEFWTKDWKVELNSVVTPWMPSASEVTTADWPSYIGQYSDFTATASTDPAKYAPWTIFKGIDGNNGRGIVSSEQKYQVTTTPAKPVDPWENSVWKTTQPTTTATNKYLWSITRTTFNLAPLTQDVIEQKAVYGDKGTDGDPGKVVSDTEPSTRFKGLTWKYSGTVDLTASDGTVIKPNTEYYYNGTHWMINFLSANNIDANSITAEKINGTDLEVKNGKFTDGVIETSWQNGTIAGSTNIQNDHLIITRTDSSANTTNSIGLDSTQGLIMVYTDNSTGRTISVGTNFQGMFLTDSTGISASISPAGVKLSSDVNWTQIGNIGGRRAEWKRENNRVTMNIHGGNGDGFPVVTSGGTLLGILPTNARPPSDISMPATAQGAGATAQISINSTGEVRCYRWGGDSVYFGAYISYYVE